LEPGLQHGIVEADLTTESALVLDDEILARIRAAKVWDKDSKLEDFQIRGYGNGLVLFNLKTRRAQLLYDDDSKLHDWKDLFSNVALLH
jgi:hypothetical protein